MNGLFVVVKIVNFVSCEMIYSTTLLDLLIRNCHFSVFGRNNLHQRYDLLDEKRLEVKQVINYARI